MSVCTLCAVGAELDPSKSNYANGESFGVSEASVRRHKAHTSPAGVGLFEDVPEAVVTSRGRTVRLEDGSYEKITWKPNAMALHQTLQYDDLAKALDEWEPVRPNLGNSLQPYTSILNAADLQIGKANQRGGGTPETLARAKQSVERFVADLTRNTPQAAVIVDNGDPIENCFNVPSQLVTNDLDVPAQIRTFRRFMIEAIKAIAPVVPMLHYVVVPSNHGAHRTGYKSPGGTTDADFGLEVSHQLEDAISENPLLKDRVVFVRPEPLHETAVVSVSNTKVAFTHGHNSSSEKTHGLWWARQDHGRMPGWDADILVTAHYHTMGLEQSGDGRWIIKTASSDPGSDWFTNRTGESALPGMTSFRVHDGQWSGLALL